MQNKNEKEQSQLTAGVAFSAQLSFNKISHSHGAYKTLDDINLVAESGEILCLLGPSGSGKTTLLRIAAGVDQQTHGQIFYNDTQMAGENIFVPPEKRGIGLMFQDFALFPHMTILDNVRYGLNVLSKKDSTIEAKAALTRVGLLSKANNYPHMLSGGQQQRVALARAIAPRPGVFLMDEPFSGLDSRLKDTIRAETLAILKERRATAIIVTHDAEEAMRMSDKIALLRDGRIEQVGTSEDFYYRPKTLFSAGFFSELNVFEGQVKDEVVSSPLGKYPAKGYKDNTKLNVVARLHCLNVHETEGSIPARIITRQFLGVVEVLELAIQGYDRLIRARIKANEVANGLRDVRVSVNQRDILLFEIKNTDTYIE